MIDKTYGLGDIVQMKKDHPCKKSQYFKITRMGADIKIKCEGCGSVIMFTRQDFEKKLKKVIERNEEL
ncbi:DUF951 domain-containing protein [Erysipelothrix rhusiopathiae]|nr:DUF951 domain-containing protein [Erysipelothrix rhusiopathiae]